MNVNASGLPATGTTETREGAAGQPVMVWVKAEDAVAVDRAWAMSVDVTEVHSVDCRTNGVLPTRPLRLRSRAFIERSADR